MLIGPNGEKEGIVSFSDAYEKAQKLSLDLVQVSSGDSNPVVCKIMDYGKLNLDLPQMSETIILN